MTAPSLTPDTIAVPCAGPRCKNQTIRPRRYCGHGCEIDALEAQRDTLQAVEAERNARVRALLDSVGSRIRCVCGVEVWECITNDTALVLFTEEAVSHDCAIEDSEATFTGSESLFAPGAAVPAAALDVPCEHEFDGYRTITGYESGRCVKCGHSYEVDSSG